MNVYERYTYPTGDLCFAPLPSQLWTKRASLELGASLHAFEELLGKPFVAGFRAWPLPWLYYRNAREGLAACTDFDEAPRRPRFGACAFHLHALG